MSLDEEEPEPILAQPEVQLPTPMLHRQGVQVAMAIRNLRQRAGLSQRQLALRMSVPRTYVSKIENEKATPTLSSLERLANALQVTVPDLITGGGREEEIKDLMKDEFIAELITFLPKLNGMQWQNVMIQMRDMTIRPRRTV